MPRTISALTKTLSTSRKVLVVCVAVVAIAVAASAAGYAAMSKSVTVSVDGTPQQVHTFGSTVGDVLAQAGIHTDSHDVVAPGPSSPVADGSVIAVKYGRPLELKVDGSAHRYWVTATNVATALDQLGLSFGNAALSASRGAAIGRRGLDLSVVTPKNLVVKVAGHKARHRTLDVLTVAQALHKLGVRFDGNDRVKPGLGSILRDGDKITFTRVTVRRRAVDERVGFATVRRADGNLPAGQSQTVRSGRAGSRHVVYRVTFVNGHLDHRKALRITVLRAPVDAIVRYGTRAAPAPVYSGGTSVWDRIAACESGGNWAENTGNGYYGGLQFSLGTWHAYGGAGYPNQASRLTQIAIATKVRNASGGYGSWPACSQQLGLPQ